MQIKITISRARYQRIVSRVLLISAVLLPFLTSCGPSRPAELARSAALDSINKSSKFSPSTADFPLSKEQAECGVRIGFWIVAGSTNRVEAALWGFRHKYKLTAKGRSTFGSIGLSYSTPEVATVRLETPHRRSAVQVTGIADYEPSTSGYHGKEVGFEWTWEASEFSDELKQCIPGVFSVHKGTAIFRLYDDGWRVEEIVHLPSE